MLDFPPDFHLFVLFCFVFSIGKNSRLRVLVHLVMCIYMPSKWQYIRLVYLVAMTCMQLPSVVFRNEFGQERTTGEVRRGGLVPEISAVSQARLPPHGHGVGCCLVT